MKRITVLLADDNRFVRKEFRKIKQSSTDNVCTAIREVHKGNTFFSPSIPKRLHNRNQKKQMD